MGERERVTACVCVCVSRTLVLLYHSISFVSAYCVCPSFSSTRRRLFLPFGRRPEVFPLPAPLLSPLFSSCRFLLTHFPHSSPAIGSFLSQALPGCLSVCLPPLLQPPTHPTSGLLRGEKVQVMQRCLSVCFLKEALSPFFSQSFVSLHLCLSLFV